MSLKFEVRHLESLQAKLRKLGPKAQRALDDALTLEAGAVLNEAQKTVPVQTGRLRSSAAIRDVKRNQHRTDRTVGYDAPYAGMVHENPNSSGYKWLERAATKVLRGTIQRIINKLRRALK